MNDNKLMNRAADNIRILAASMVEKAIEAARIRMLSVFLLLQWLRKPIPVTRVAPWVVLIL